MKIYSGKFCVPCRMLKEWLQENNIEIEELMVDEHTDDVVRLQIKQTPTLVLDDERLIAGKDNIIEYLEELMEVQDV